MIQQILVLLARGGGERTPHGLDDQARDIGGEEKEGIPLGGDAGEGRVESEGGVLDDEVDGGAEDGGREDDDADLELEGVAVPGIVVEDDAADVACASFSFLSHITWARGRGQSRQGEHGGVDDAPIVSRTHPIPTAAEKVHVLPRMPITAVARSMMPKATVKKMLAPRLGA